MPVYHFGSVASERIDDEDGVELADDDAARLVATQFVGEILKNEPEALWRAGSIRVDVTNDSGTLLYSITAMSAASG